MVAASVSVDMEQTSKLPAPPYISFLTFLHLIEWLEQEGAPLRFDRSFWSQRFSGSTGAQLLAALRFLNLINGAQTKPDLDRLVAAQGDNRKAVLLDIIRKSYGTIQYDLLGRATPDMLGEWLDIYQIDGDTKRKAESFLINALKFVDHPLSVSLRKKARIKRPKSKEQQVPKTSIPRSASLVGSASPQAPTNVKTVRLASGGDVSISMNVDLFTLSETDRAFVLALIDQVRKYSMATGNGKDEEGTSPSNGHAGEDEDTA